MQYWIIEATYMRIHLLDLVFNNENESIIYNHLNIAFCYISPNYKGIRVLHICLNDDHDVHVVAMYLGLEIHTVYTYVLLEEA